MFRNKLIDHLLVQGPAKAAVKIFEDRKNVFTGIFILSSFVVMVLLAVKLGNAIHYDKKRESELIVAAVTDNISDDIGSLYIIPSNSKDECVKHAVYLATDGFRSKTGVAIDDEIYPCLLIKQIEFHNKFKDVLNIPVISSIITDTIKNKYEIEYGLSAAITTSSSPAIFISEGHTVNIKLYDLPHMKKSFLCFGTFSDLSCHEFRHKSKFSDNIIFDTNAAIKLGISHVTE